MAALKGLMRSFPRLRRVGSVGYRKSAADLVQEGPEPFRLIATRDKRRPVLVTLAVDDLHDLMVGGLDLAKRAGVVVQVKGRERTWIGRLYDELKAAT